MALDKTTLANIAARLVSVTANEYIKHLQQVRWVYVRRNSGLPQKPLPEFLRPLGEFPTWTKAKAFFDLVTAQRRQAVEAANLESSEYRAEKRKEYMRNYMRRKRRSARARPMLELGEVCLFMGPRPGERDTGEYQYVRYCGEAGEGYSAVLFDGYITPVVVKSYNVVKREDVPLDPEIKVPEMGLVVQYIPANPRREEEEFSSTAQTLEELVGGES